MPLLRKHVCLSAGCICCMSSAVSAEVLEPVLSWHAGQLCRFQTPHTCPVTAHVRHTVGTACAVNGCQKNGIVGLRHSARCDPWQLCWHLSPASAVPVCPGCRQAAPQAGVADAGLANHACTCCLVHAVSAVFCQLVCQLRLQWDCLSLF
jgi:hypothetical protein